MEKKFQVSILIRGRENFIIPKNVIDEQADGNWEL